MSQIQELTDICTSVILKPRHRINQPGSKGEVLVQSHVSIQGKDGCFHYADINSEGTTIDEAIDKALRVATAFKKEILSL